MVDIFAKAERSRIMARVRGRDNVSTELLVVKLFRSNGVTGWRRQPSLFGKPDFAFPKARVAVFVDGCFWHGCPRHRRTPKTRVTFWSTKLARNAARDSKVSRELRAMGWTVLRVWECALTRTRGEATAARIARALIQKAAHRD